MAKALEQVVRVPVLPPREPSAHKGTFGHVLLVGGSTGMVGAPALMANAALRAGAGLVTVAVPAAIQQTVAGLCPCAISLPLPPDPPAALEALDERLARCDVLAIGPGAGPSALAGHLVRALLEQDKPVVFDADALNLLATMDGWPARRRCPAVLTPHPGELARLTGRRIDEIQSDRRAAATTCAADWAGAAPAAPLVVALKGQGTVVADGRAVYVNPTGNPGMASGGTGDVLTGVVAALMGQGLGPFDAAVLGVYVHGRAGDLAAEDVGQVSLIATDLLNALPRAFRSLAGDR